MAYLYGILMRLKKKNKINKKIDELVFFFTQFCNTVLVNYIMNFSDNRMLVVHIS